MKLYNTLTRQIDKIAPLNPPKVTVYTCGPTVYDYAHIGHWYNYVRMDTLIRALKLSGLQPDWVMNITDVGHLVSDADEGEDKLEKGARREGKTAWEVAEFYTADFMECMHLLGINTPDHITKATDHIKEQIELIQKLEANGFTYVINDGVYYDTSKFEGYAAFARLDLDDQQEGARVAVNEQKRNGSDFALWKFSPTDHQRDMEWDSPWGKGFPGWHIECSAMAMKYLGDTLDIHTGGIDHITVHHTNEIAQSEGATGKRFANHWMHSNHVMVNGEKISKSLNNGIRLQDILEKGNPVEAIRLNILESHYRSQSQFSWESLEAAKNRLTGFRSATALRWQASPDTNETPLLNFVEAASKLREYLKNDLDTPEALAFLNRVFDIVSSAGIMQREVADFSAFLKCIDDAFELNLSKIPDISEEQKTQVADRNAAREAKDWARSDELRDQLTAQGIGIRDTSYGAVWYPL